jgi:hypothetical protein
LRKLAILPVALVATLALAQVAGAQSSTYEITASTSPAKAGSKKRPVPVSIRFGAKAEGTGRPSTSSRFAVTFGGIRANTRGFKTCTVAQINAAQSDNGCSSSARIGTGSVNNLVGQAADPNDTSISCTLNVTIYNGGGGKAAIFLRGGPTVPGAPCPVSVNQALDGTFSNTRAGVRLSFDIPANLMHPITGLNQGINELTATLSRKTARVRGKRVNLLESTGGCRGGKRQVVLELTAEAGGSSTSRGTARCS